MSDANDKPTEETKPNNVPNPNGNTEGETWLRNELSRTRDEAANRRIEARTANEQLESARSEATSAKDAKEKAETRATKAESDLMKLNIALKAGVPGDRAAEFAELLQGDTEEALTEYANKIVGFTGNQGGNDRATDHSQARGYDNGNKPASTPQEEFAEMFGNLPMFRK